jgi:hypothetical protein
MDPHCAEPCARMPERLSELRQARVDVTSEGGWLERFDRIARHFVLMRLSNVFLNQLRNPPALPG